MSLSEEKVRHVAQLARLELAAHEVEHLVTDLGNILKYVEQLREVDTPDAEPLQAPGVRQLPLCADSPRPGLSHDQALAPAARTLHDGFAVPAIMDES